jgi:hypothetical protein
MLFNRSHFFELCPLFKLNLSLVKKCTSRQRQILPLSLERSDLSSVREHSFKKLRLLYMRSLLWNTVKCQTLSVELAQEI